MYKYLIIFATSLLFGCATNAPQSTAANPASTSDADFDSMKQEMVGDLVALKLKENGVRLLCEEESYRSCFNLSYQTCYRQTQPYSEECYDRARSKVNAMTTKEDVGNLFAYHFMCIATKNLAQSSDLKASAACLKNFKIDKDRALKTLFESSSSI